MWEKRICSILLSLVLAITAIPLSTLPAYVQAAETVQDGPEAGKSDESVKTEAAGAAVSEEEAGDHEEAAEAAGTEALSEETEDAGTEDAVEEAQEEDLSEEESGQDAAAPEDGAVNGQDADAGTGREESPEAEPASGEDADAVTAEPAAGEDADAAMPEPAAGEDADAAMTEPAAEAADADASEAADSAEAPDQAAQEPGQGEEITAEPADEAVSEEAKASGEEAEYNVNIESRYGKMVVFPGERILLDAHAFRNKNGEVSSDGLLYKWEIVDGNDDGYVSFEDGIEGTVGDYPSATLLFSGDPDPQVCDHNPDAFKYMITVKVTVFDGTDAQGNPAEKVSAELDGIQLQDEYFEINPLRIDQLAIGESREIPFSIRCFSYYYNDFRFGYDTAWRFTYDENVLEVTDPDGNILDGTGTAVFEPGVDEPVITIRRISGGDTHLKADVTFSYVDHNGTTHKESTFGADWYFDIVWNEDERIWFDINENRIFHDGTYTFDLYTENIPEEYDVNVVVGHYGDEGLVEAYTEGQEYDFDGTKLTLYGDKIGQRGYRWFGLEVQAVSRQDGRVLCGNRFGRFESKEPFENYSFEEDRELLPGWYDTINHREHVYVENAEHPDGWDTEYEVTGVEIVSQDPAEEGRDVLDIRMYYRDDDHSSDDYWWHYEGRNHGTAVLRVSYKDIRGNENSYTFSVYVQEDIYGVLVSTEDGSTIARPGETIRLNTEVWHHSENEEAEGNTDGLVYVWNLKELDGHPDPDTFAELRTAAGGKSATVTFRAPEGFGEDDWFELETEVFIYRGSVAEENKVGYDRIHLAMAERYVELWPTQIDSDMEVGYSMDVTAEFRFYPGEGGQEYNLVGADDGSVTYYWHYDDRAVRVYDSSGRQVGNNDDAGEYIGSAGSTGPSCTFTIYRRRQFETDIFLDACWTDPDGEEHWESRRLHLDEKNYRAWINKEDDGVYSDGSSTYTVETEGIPENAAYGTDYEIEMAVGLFEEDEEGAVITDAFTEGEEYTFDGTALTFNGEKLAARGLQDDQEFCAQLLLKVNGESTWVEETFFRYREARADYDREYDHDMLAGWNGSVRGSYNVYVENSEYPNGHDEEYRVLDARLISDEPWDGEPGSVVDDFHYDEDENDPSNYWWYYHVENCGEATIEVTYEDLEGQQLKYTFTLYVGDDVYSVYMDSVDKDRVGLPGDRFELFAGGRHEYYEYFDDGHREYRNNSEGLDYQWSLKEGEEFARLEVDETDHAKAFLILNELPEGQDWIDEKVRVGVRILDKDGKETNGYDETEFWVRSEFFEIWPLSLDPDMEVGQSVDVTTEFRFYPGGDGREYDLVSDRGGSVTYFWHYDDGAVQVYDSSGRQVGNDDDAGEYIGSVASTGSSCTFTIYRRRQWDTDIFLDACWTDPDGEDHWEGCRLHLDEKNYRAWINKEDDRVYSDGSSTYTVDTEGVPENAVYGTDYEIEMAVGLWDYDREEIAEAFTEGVEYTFDGTTLTFNGEKLKARGLQDDQEFCAQLLLKVNGESTWVEETFFRYREARADYDREYDRDMLAGWDGSVRGSYNVHVENSEYPDGHDEEYRVLDVQLISDEPWDSESGSVVDDFHEDHDENDPSDRWWYYHVENRGKATFEVTYEDLEGQEQKYTFDLYVGDDVYSVYMDSVDKDRTGLPGDRFELFADGHHEFYEYYDDGHKEYRNEPEGFDYQWSLEEGEEFARLEVDESDHAKAILILNEMPEGQDWIDEMIRVSVQIFDEDGNETGGYDGSNFWVKSDFYEIWPLSLDPDLDVGASIEEVKFEVRQYSIDKENYEVIDDRFDVQYEWHYDQNALAISEKRDGTVTTIADCDTAEGNTFTFTRLGDWHTNFDVKAYWTHKWDGYRDAWGNYWLNDKYYEIRFFNDEDTIRSNEKKSFAIDTEGLGEFKPDILLIVNYQSKEGDIDDVDNFTDMTEGVEYTVDPSGTSVTVDGKLVEKRLTESAYDKDRFFIGAAMIYQGEILGNSWRWCKVEMERVYKEDQEISASDVTVSMFESSSASVTGAQGALTFISGDEAIVKVDAATGELTPVAPGTTQITVNAAETQDYFAGSTTFNVTVKKADLSKAVITTNAPAAGYVYNGKSQKPSTVTVKYNGVTLKAGTDYTVTYPSDQVNVGAKTFTVKAAGNSTQGSKNASYKIVRANQSMAVKTSAEYILEGKTAKITVSGVKETTAYAYASSNTGVATVSIAGTVTGKAVGKVTITVKTPQTRNYNAASKTVSITVLKAMKKPGNCRFEKWNNTKYSSCQVAWNKTDGAQGYETLLCWTDGSHATKKTVKSNVLTQNCTVTVNHVSQFQVRAYYDSPIGRQYSPWSNLVFITPSPTTLTKKNVSPSGSDLRMQIGWNIIYGCNGYNVFLTTNPNGTWYWNQSTSELATELKATVVKYRGSKLKKNQNYYVRIVTRRKRNGVFCTVPMPANNTNIGYFVFK